MSLKVPTPITDKNGKQTTVHKKQEVVSTKAVILPAPSIRNSVRADREENLAATDELILAYHSSNGGVLRSVTRMSGSTSFSTGAFIGSKSNGDGLYVKLELDRFDFSGDANTHLDDNLEPISEFWDVRMTASMNDKTGHGIGSGNHIFGTLDEFSAYSGDDLDIIKDAFDDTAFNIARPGTPAQIAEVESMGLKFYDIPGNELEKLGIKDDNGHVFGSVSIVHEINADRIAEVLDLFTRARQF